MSKAAGRKRKYPNYHDAEYPATKRATNPGMFNPISAQNKTSQYPMYKYVSPIAKKLMPGPSVKKTEYHAVVNYPQTYGGTLFQGGPDPAADDVAYTTCKGLLYPHVTPNQRAQALTMCATGNSSTDRTGNAVDAKGIQLYVAIKPPVLHLVTDANESVPITASDTWRSGGNGANPQLGEAQNGLLYAQSSQVRIVVLLDKDFTGGKPPRVTDVFTDGCFTGGPVS